MRAAKADHISLAARSAELSPCGTYRYWLHRGRRDIEPALRHTVSFLLLNPSTADATIDDATVRKCWTYAMLWGMTDMVFVNTNPFRARDPKSARLPTGSAAQENDMWIERAALGSELFVGAWTPKAAPVLVARALEVLKREHVKIYALDVAKDGSPKHPLYLRGDLKPTLWWPK